MGRIDADVILGRRYRLLHRIAVGGMGSVWEAEDELLHRPVAVKLLSDALASDPRFIERFRREARAAAGLTHPNVAGVFDYGEDGDGAYIVMELIPGETLAARLYREGRLPPAESVRIAAEAAAALESAHGAGVLHRDIKPGNIMLTPDGTVKVMDFGIASPVAGAAQRLTATGTTLGTATYISPEQASGGSATPASDVYSLGVVLYEMLTGHPPFEAEEPVAVAVAHVRESPRPVRSLAPDVPPQVAAATERALEKDPALRPESAAAFARLLTDPGAQAEAPPAPPQPRSGAGGGDPTLIVPAVPVTGVLPDPARATGGAAAGRTAVLRTPDRPPGRRRRRWLAVAMGGVVALLLLGLFLVLVIRHDGTASPATVTVPSVAGMTRDQAVTAITGQGLVVGSVIEVPGGPDGVAIRTDPPAGQRLQPGGTVTLYVGKATPPGQEHGRKGKGKGKGGNTGDD
jgi:hypothetical protein